MTIYAIGDLHGCSEALDRLLARIAAHRAGREARILFLGDYVDRGPDSRGVLERVIAVADIALCGNHEDMMLAALDGSERAVGHWLANGGHETMESYGCRDMDALRRTLPERHRRFLQALPLTHEADGTLFVHAGIRPGRPLAEQTRRDLLWIRDGFLDHPGPFERFVVHGHTPDPGGPQILAHRANADTACVRGGPLTALVVEGARVVDVLQVPGGR